MLLSSHFLVTTNDCISAGVCVFVIVNVSWLYDVWYPGTVSSDTVYTILLPSALYVGNFSNVYSVPFIVSVFTKVPSAYRLIVICSGLIPSWLLLSFHIFVIDTDVSSFTTTVSSSSSSLGPSGTVAVATLYIFSKFAVSFSVTV